MFHIMHYTFKNLLCKLDNFLFQLFHITFQLWDLHVLVLLNRIQLIFLLFFLCLNVTPDSNVTINIEAYLNKLRIHHFKIFSSCSCISNNFQILLKTFKHFKYFLIKTIFLKITLKYKILIENTKSKVNCQPHPKLRTEALFTL